MKSLLFAASLAAVVGLTVSGCQESGTQPSAPVAGTVLDRPGEDAPPPAGPNGGGTLQQELARARAATARYHNIENALADGYVDIGVVLPGMGHHYMNMSLLDETFEIERPEMLVYAPVGGNDRLHLVALEYAVPLDLLDEAPEGYTGDEDVWGRVEDAGIWGLHAWIWYNNPDGMFAPTNPRIP